MRCQSNQDIHAHEAQRDWEGERASEVRELNNSVALAKEELAFIEDDLDDLKEYESLTEEQEIERARLCVEINRKKYAPWSPTTAPFTLADVAFIQGRD